jgi:hypothetical protein
MSAQLPSLQSAASSLRAREEGDRMKDLSLTNEVGFAAAGLVLATFCMRSMSALRWVAIASNLAFIAYGYLGGLAPILLLHALLLPVNIYRLAQLRIGLGRNKPTGARLRTPPFFDGLQGEVLNDRAERPGQTGGSHA